MSNITAKNIISCIRHADLRNNKKLTVKIEWLTELANTIQTQDAVIAELKLQLKKEKYTSTLIATGSIKNLNQNLGDYLDEEA